MRNAARVGLQTEELVWKSVNSIPCSAICSMRGVLTQPLYRAISQQPRSSARMTTMLGGLSACAEFGTATQQKQFNKQTSMRNIRSDRFQGSEE